MKSPEKIELSPEAIKQLTRRLKEHALRDKDYKLLEGIINTVIFLNHTLREKKISINRLRSLLGIKTEKSSRVLKDIESAKELRDEESGVKDDEKVNKQEEDLNEESFSEGREGKKGHGRNGVNLFTGAEKVFVPHATLKAGDNCPGCHKGRICDMKRPGVIVTITGSAPLNGTVYELQKLRCALCGEVFTAELSKDIKKEKYDQSAATMIALLKYGCGFPFYRLDVLQKSLGIPVPATTQWEMVENLANIVEPIYRELVETAAQGEVIHNDDTTAKILSLNIETPMNGQKNEDKDKSSRKGTFTTGIVSKVNDFRIALYFTGRNHAGENMTELLKYRALDKSPPIQMCDALSRNISSEFETILCNCLTHGRRQFVEIIEHFPQECYYVIKILKEVYHNDKITKKMEMSPDKRLLFHQEKSGPLMEELKQWIEEQFIQKTVEPNSSLGKSLRYFQNHWEPLTRFLQIPGAPLDNNIVERTLKKAILHRKNCYFYKTENGARVGDLFMCIIETCRLNKVNPFDYLTTIQKYYHLVVKNIDKWMPWNYREAVYSFS